MQIVIIDYGMGNLRSVQKACEYLGYDAVVTSDSRILTACDVMILPGVGEFGSAMDELNRRGLVRVIKDHVAAGRTFIGICLGMQLLFDSSEETADTAGLGLFKGTCKRFEPAPHMPVPHMGWNNVTIANNNNDLFKGMENDPYFYFVHSYYVVPEDESVIAGITEYGIKYPGIIRKGNITAVQFHPEKSQAAGLKLLENMIKS